MNFYNIYIMRKFCSSLIIFFLLIIILLTMTPIAQAASMTKRVENKHIITIPESPVLIPISVKVSDSYTGTYTDKATKRTFSRHKETLTVSSINDPYLTTQLNPTIGFLQFTTTTKKCNHIKCKCNFFINPNSILKHHCSNTSIVCTKGSNTYCKGGYFITGGVAVVSKSIKFTNLAK